MCQKVSNAHFFFTNFIVFISVLLVVHNSFAVNDSGGIFFLLAPLPQVEGKGGMNSNSLYLNNPKKIDKENAL